MEKKTHPPSTKEVIFYTEDSKHVGFYVEDINKYVRNVKRWKDTETNTWYDDDKVVAWYYLQ